MPGLHTNTNRCSILVVTVIIAGLAATRRADPGTRPENALASSAEKIKTFSWPMNTWRSSCRSPDTPHAAGHSSRAARRPGTDSPVPELAAAGPEGAIADVAFREAVVASVRHLINESGPSRLTFVAESLGTLVVALADDVMAAGVARVEVIWLTPTFGVEAIRDAAIARGWRSLVVSGDADRWYDRDATETLVAAVGGEALTIEGGDHSLIIDRDVFATVEGLRRLVEAVLRFAA